MSNNFQKIFYKAKFFIKKNSPVILLVGGILASAGAIVTASIASTKLDKTLKPKNEALDLIEKKLESKEVDENEAKKRRTKVYIKTGFDLVKLYAIPAGLYAASLGCFIGGHKILSNRNAALITGYSALQASYNACKNRLKEIENGTQPTEEKGGEQICVPKKSTDLDKGIFDFVFDNTFDDWDNLPSLTLGYLQSKERWYTNKLNLQGYLTVYDILKDMGVNMNRYSDKVINASRAYGWLSKYTNSISLGLYNPDGTDTIDATNMKLYGEKNFFVRLNPYYIFDSIGQEIKKHS